MNKKFFFHVMCSVCLLACLLVSFVPAEANGGNKGINYPAYMQGIDYGTGITYVIGHKPPDSDSVCTVIAYANLKRKLGINAEARIGSPINAESAYALNYFGVDVPEYLDNAAGKKEGALESAEAAFGKGNGNVISLGTNLSRKKVVRLLQPAIAKCNHI